MIYRRQLIDDLDPALGHDPLAVTVDLVIAAAAAVAAVVEVVDAIVIAIVVTAVVLVIAASAAAVVADVPTRVHDVIVLVAVV
jgi:hypothetical protein